MWWKITGLETSKHPSAHLSAIQVNSLCGKLHSDPYTDVGHGTMHFCCGSCG